jgi:hypothetical protein
MQLRRAGRERKKERDRDRDTHNIELVNVFFFSFYFSNDSRKRDSNESAYYYWVGHDAGVCVVYLRDPRMIYNNIGR